MRDINRIKTLLSYIEKIWLKYPDLRLMQLLQNVLDKQDNYYLEDEVLLDKLKFNYDRLLEIKQ